MVTRFVFQLDPPVDIFTFPSSCHFRCMRSAGVGVWNGDQIIEAETAAATADPDIV